VAQVNAAGGAPVPLVGGCETETSAFHSRARVRSWNICINFHVPNKMRAFEWHVERASVVPFGTRRPARVSGSDACGSSNLHNRNHIDAIPGSGTPLVTFLLMSHIVRTGTLP